MAENLSDVEPRTVLINSLIGYNYMVEQMLYIHRQPMTECVHALLGLINMLDLESQANLKQQYDKIIKFFSHTGSMTKRVEVYQLHKEIMQYLHKTYLVECKFVKPKFRQDTNLELPDQ